VPWPASAPSVSSSEAEAAAAAMSGRASAGRDASSCRCTPGSLSDSSGDPSPALLTGFPTSPLMPLLGPLLSPSPLPAPLSVLLARHWSTQGDLEGTQVAATMCRAAAAAWLQGARRQSWRRRAGCRATPQLLARRSLMAHLQAAALTKLRGVSMHHEQSEGNQCVKLANVR